VLKISFHFIPIIMAYNLVMQILIVEDEEKIANLLQKGLLEERFQVDTASDGEEALYKFSLNTYDLIILDLMIPKVSGAEVCKAIRKTNTVIPILMLTAKREVDDKISGLDTGADDYLTKPFSFGELTARIRALIRRGKKADPVVLAIDNLTLDPATKSATRGGKQITLTAREYALLEYFMRNPNTLITKTQLLEHIWDHNYDGFSNVVETYVKYLRKKLKASPDDKELIHTRRRSGYLFGLLS
jgi:DNA-binding response OmpR family regulator